MTDERTIYAKAREIEGLAPPFNRSNEPEWMQGQMDPDDITRNDRNQWEEEVEELIDDYESRGPYTAAAFLSVCLKVFEMPKEYRTLSLNDLIGDFFAERVAPSEIRKFKELWEEFPWIMYSATEAQSLDYFDPGMPSGRADFDEYVREVASCLFPDYFYGFEEFMRHDGVDNSQARDKARSILIWADVHDEYIKNKKEQEQEETKE